jgi:hypothetical protein
MPELQRIRGEVPENTADGRGTEEAFCPSIELADQQWALAEIYARFSDGYYTADLRLPNVYAESIDSYRLQLRRGRSVVCAYEQPSFEMSSDHFDVLRIAC